MIGSGDGSSHPAGTTASAPPTVPPYANSRRTGDQASGANRMEETAGSGASSTRKIDCKPPAKPGGWPPPNVKRMKTASKRFPLSAPAQRPFPLMEFTNPRRRYGNSHGRHPPEGDYRRRSKMLKQES